MIFPPKIEHSALEAPMGQFARKNLLNQRRQAAERQRFFRYDPIHRPRKFSLRYRSVRAQQDAEARAAMLNHPAEVNAVLGRIIKVVVGDHAGQAIQEARIHFQLGSQGLWRIRGVDHGVLSQRLHPSLKHEGIVLDYGDLWPTRDRCRGRLRFIRFRESALRCLEDQLEQVLPSHRLWQKGIGAVGDRGLVIFCDHAI